MRTRSLALSKAPAPPLAYSLDLVLLTPHGGRLAVLLTRTSALPSRERSRERWSLPWTYGRADEGLADGAARAALEALDGAPAWLEQVAAFGDGRRHPAATELSVAFVGLVPMGTPLPEHGESMWFPLAELPALAPRQRTMIEQAVALLRARLDQLPIAFHLLPPTFTLSELQEMYELLLGRPLHKASFRRSLQAAWLVEPLDEWRCEGRGRPAQLYRYAPRKRRPQRRSVRFEFLGG